MDQSKTRGVIRVAMHVHAYLWIGLTLVSTIPFLYISRRIYGPEYSEQAISTLLAMIVAFQALFWFARRYCTVDDLSAWDGLLLVAAYMSVGIGNFYVLIAVGAVGVAAIGMILIASLSFLHGGKPAAARRYRTMVLWFYHHRMFQ